MNRDIHPHPMTSAFPIPADTLRAPAPVANIVTDELLSKKTVAIYGHAQDLSRLADSPAIESLWISGVNERAAEVLSQFVHVRRLVVHDYRLRDLKYVSKLTTLEHLAIAGRSYVRSLVGLEALATLRCLILSQLSHYHTVDALTNLKRLDTLCLEGPWSGCLRLDTLRPLAALNRLRHLRLTAIRVADKSLQPLHRLTALQTVFIADAFPAAEFNALAKALPNARGEWLDTYRAGRSPT